MTPAAFAHQTGQMLFPKILWNRPVSRHGAGRLLVVGGHGNEFSAATALHALAVAAGAGECIVALPDSLRSLLAGTPSTSFFPSTQSGSLSRDALGQLLYAAEDADAVAVGANLSNNSETAILIERLVQESERPIIAFDEAMTALQFNARLLSDNPDNLLILTMPELFKLAGRLQVSLTIRRDGGLLNKVEIVQAMKAAVAADLVVYGTETIVTSGGQISVTPANPVLSRLPAAYWAALSVFWLQHKSQRYEALTTAAWVLHQAGGELKQQETPTVTPVANSITRALEAD